MKLAATRNDFLKPVATVFPAIERKNSLPILQNVLIQAGRETRMTATDLEMELAMTSSALQAEEPGDITLPAKRLLDILRAFPEDATVVLTVDPEGKATIKSGRSRFTLQTLSANDYPCPDQREYHAKITVPQHGLYRLMAETTYAMARQDVRYYLNGCLFDFDLAKLRCVATDGHRLGFREMDATVEADEPGQVILPIKGVNSLMKLLDADSEEPVSLQIGRNHLRLENGSIHFTSKLIDGKFPDYHRVVPTKFEHTAIMDRAQFAEMIKRVGLLLNDKTTGVRFALEDWKLTLHAKNSDQEEAEEEMDINYQGGPIETGFNSSYLQDAVNALTGELVKVQMSDAQSSMLIEEAEGAGSRHVIMPMRL